MSEQILNKLNNLIIRIKENKMSQDELDNLEKILYLNEKENEDYNNDFSYEELMEFVFLGWYLKKFGNF